MKTLKKAMTEEAVSSETGTGNVQFGVYKNVPENLIEFSPLNYRKMYSQKALEEFAKGLADHGILHPVTLRKTDDNILELVIGERRLRAARLIGLKEIPSIIKVLSDQQVKEMQLLENIQRENPHPLQEANAILSLQSDGKGIAEIASILGKSQAFVFNRIRLTQLIEEFHEVFIEDKLNINQAWELAGLDPESQKEFYEDHCKDWKKANFSLGNFQYILNRYKFDLKKAPFNIKDKMLLPNVGSCQGCNFNSATMKSLFPELAKEAICSNKSCFKEKALTHLTRLVQNGFEEHKPDAILHYGNLSDELRMIFDSLSECNALPQYCVYDISRIESPIVPDKEDYMEMEEDEEEGIFDEDGYSQALQEYQSDLEAYNAKLELPEILKGILIKNNEVLVYRFNPVKESNDSASKPKITAKEVQEAIKDGTVTPELLQAEIERIEAREARAKEIDLDTNQKNIHSQFLLDQETVQPEQKLTDADQLAIRLVVYQSLDYSVRSKVDEAFFGEKSWNLKKEKIYETLSKLTEAQFCFLIRMAVAGKSDSKLPNTLTGMTLYKIAFASGTDVSGIEKQRANLAKERAKKVKLRIADLKRRIKDLALKMLK